MKHLPFLLSFCLIPFFIKAQSPEPFECSGSDGFGYYSSSASNSLSGAVLTYSSSRISKITTLTGNRETLCEPATIGTSINGLAFNPHDNFLYAVSRFDPIDFSGKLYRIGSNCEKMEITVTGNIMKFSTNNINTIDAAGGNISSATFDLDNNYYVNTSFTNTSSTGFTNKLQTISLDGDNATVTSTVNLTCPSCTGSNRVRVTDMIFDEASGLLYGSNKETNKLYSIDPDTGILLEVGTTGQTSSILGVYKNRDGNVRAINEDGNIYSVDLVTGNFTLLSTSTTLNSGNADGASGCYQPPHLSGKLFLDQNGLSDGTVNGICTNMAGSTLLYANLFRSGQLLRSVPLAADGSYIFEGLFSGNYEVQISTLDGIASASNPLQELPAEYVFVGDNIGLTPGDDTTPNGAISVKIANGVDIDNVNFSINGIPITNDLTAEIQENPENDIQVNVPELVFTDPEETDINNITIVSLPDPNTQGVLYYDGSPVTTNQLIPNYNPNLLTVDPVDGIVTVTFTYITTDMANINSNISTVNIPFNNTILPVVLSRFTVINKQQSNIITWTTESEIDVEYFSLESSRSGDGFTEISRTKSYNNTTTPQQYTTTDKHPADITYYRLKIVDLDGRYEYSDIISITINRANQVRVYPTLAGEILNVDIQEEEGQSYSITDPTAKVILAGNLDKGSNTLDIQSLAKGIYFISIGKYKNTMSTHKFVKM